jgi:hypothetical protein
VFPVKYGLYLCSIWFSQQTASVSLNSINRLGSVAETSSVFCELRTVSVFRMVLTVNSDCFPKQH